ncbi:hypothetical protein CBER1_03575 [Cercospora berteroae]|uniref:Uncharacterized protein n=1 Tax=Cercospora berteroae TaxID=357750 RepID=A0A2S6C8D9_9PEZI|nr:hypothetical protein CBER1_03575 [Cercospora berteroae]
MAAEKKPTFGPLENPAIFADKWLRRFHTHVFAVESLEFRDEMTNWTTIGFELLLAFEEQSSALGYNKELLSTIFVHSEYFLRSPAHVWRMAEKLRDLVNWALDEATRSIQADKDCGPEEKARFDALVDRITLATKKGKWNGDVPGITSKQLEHTKLFA